MTSKCARAILLCNAAGAALYAALHLYLAWARHLPVSINFALLLVLLAAALVASLATQYDHRFALMLYSVALWAAVTAMAILYASDPRCTGVPGVVLWLAPGAALAGTCGSRQIIVYLQLTAVSFLWIVLVYNDVDYALVRYPLIIGAALAGCFYRELEALQGQFRVLETALRILNNAPQGRERP